MAKPIDQATLAVNVSIGDNITFKKLIENSFSGITLLNKHFQIIYRTPSAERITGWITAKSSKAKIDKLIHPSDRKRVRQLLKEVLLSPGVPLTCSFQSLHFNGHYIWLECTYTNMFHEADINAIVCNFVDVTAQKKSEASLQQTVDELTAYKHALDEADIVAITVQNGIIKHVNDNFCKISKYTRDEIIGRDHRILNSSHHRKAFMRNLWVTIANGKIWKGEIKNKAKDGSYYWVDTAIVPFLNKAGAPYQYVAISHDITASKLFQDRIIESQRFITTITDNVPAMIAYWSADLQCMFANRACLEWFEMTADEMMGTNKNTLLGGTEFEACQPYIENVLQGRSQRFERTFFKEAGKTIYTQTQYVPDRQEGVIKGFYSLIYDISEIKATKTKLEKSTAQIADLLENITDGFIALDENMCYTHANRQIGEMLGIKPSTLIGKNIWDVFPDAVGSATHTAIKKAYAERKYVCYEDYYKQLDLWQENRIYPSGNGVDIFIRDITKRKREEDHLRLLESVIVNATDAVLITEAAPLDGSGPKIIYVNESFTKMTGYSREEIIGQTPNIFQGPKSDKRELKRLSEAMRNFKSCEITTINYRKNGDEFWVNFTISPVKDNNGIYTHFIGIERDVTERKHEELKRDLLTSIGLIFNKRATLKENLTCVLKELVDFGGFSIAEAWLTGADKTKINLVSRCVEEGKILEFYDDTADIKTLKLGEGLPGITWQNQEPQFLENIDRADDFVHRGTPKKAGLKSAYGVPLIYNNETIGVFVLGLKAKKKQPKVFDLLPPHFSTHIGTEIKRKQLEEELNEIFNCSPDILCIADTEGYLKKINPAMSTILEYSEEELLAQTVTALVHPEDRTKSIAAFKVLKEDASNIYFECRYITKSGKVKWLAWTSTIASEETLLFSVAKDITDKKELEVLLNKANSLARLGSWEIDMLKKTLYWSAITKEIHETSPDFEPTLETGINFYKEGNSRETIIKKIREIIEDGKACDVELQIVTAKNNIKWIRVTGEAEYIGNECVRVNGSFQDIDARKTAELTANEALEERNTILESIDDAFFAVDKNWIVTYWNSSAERVLKVKKEEILSRYLWDIFSTSIGSESYKKYRAAVKTNQVVHFEDYYSTLQKWYEISAYPSLSGLSVYFKDITERKTTENRLKELNENLKKQSKELSISNTELEQFAYVASHDLQEPLRMVTSFLTRIESKYSDSIDETGKQYIHFAVDGAKRMRQIILDLLEFSKVGKSETQLEIVDLNELMRDIITLYGKQIEENRAIINFTNLPVLTLHRVKIRQVFQNLIGNALKYQKKSLAPVINIACVEFRDYWQFSVSDNGIGINQEYFDTIFVIFKRLHNKDEYTGTGMGLAITKKIIESTGGQIWLESEEGKGSIFYFTILKPQ